MGNWHGGIELTLRHQTENFVNASWRLVGLRDVIYEAVGLLLTELSDKGSIAGDDDAGRFFAAKYKPAVHAVFDRCSYGHIVMASGAQKLLESAENFLRTESRIAAELLGEGPFTPGIAAQPAGPDCTPRASHSAADLPDVVGETSWIDRYLFNQRNHGAAEKLKSVAGTWRAARRLLEDVYWDAYSAGQRATMDQAGDTADAAKRFFAKYVDKHPPPSDVSEHETLFANLPTACKLLANACDAYADHVETAQRRVPEEADPVFGERLPIWEEPVFGGQGHDGGLYELVADDDHIKKLDGIPPALGVSRGKIEEPHHDQGSGPWLPMLPIPTVRGSVRVFQAGFNNGLVRVQPVAPPNPPDARFPALTAPQQQRFKTWLTSLPQKPYTGGNPQSNEASYQMRVSGSPEYGVHIPRGISASNRLMVDGMRDRDGMAVEAKYVKNEGRDCYRTVDELRRAHHGESRRDFMFEKDREELVKYQAAVQHPGNSEMRGVETVTNYRDAVPYWRVMMAAYGIKGYSRYVP
nr:restriction endonuclease fold toxin-2 domain-containing protein [Streptomyces bathyalis]